MVPLLLAFAAVPLAHTHLPACAIYVQGPSPAEAAQNAALVREAIHRRTSPAQIGTIMTAADWRIVWATPEQSEEGAFFFRRAGRGYRLAGTWGGIAQAAERGDVVAWAVRRGVPAALAQCFASRVVDGQ